MKTRNTVLVMTIFALALAVSTIEQVSVPNSAGKRWLSWPQDVKSLFVEAYKAGYVGGKSDACETAAQIFEPHERITDFSRSASARCFQRTRSYSNTIEHYAGVMTDFYSKYPQYERIPYTYVMFVLSDDRYKTADEIYHAALKGEIRTNFQK